MEFLSGFGVGLLVGIFITLFGGLMYQFYKYYNDREHKANN